MSAFAQTDPIVTYKYSIEVDSLNTYEFEDMCDMLTECTFFGFSFFCTEENLFITEAYLDLTKLEFMSLVETVVDSNRVKLTPINKAEEFHCSSNTKNIIIKD